MFEKEAQEYLKKDGTKAEQILDMLNEISPLKMTLKQLPFMLAMMKQLYQDGAEFGYNKAFVEADKNLKAVVADFNKANEWHYVKDELPPIKKEYNGRSELVLVLSKEKEMQYAQYVEKEKTWARGICEISFVPYAWKEIILPKEIE